MNILAIDPSARNKIGIGVLNIDSFKKIKVEDATFSIQSNATLEDLCKSCVRFINQKFIDATPFSYLVIEYPQYMGGLKGRIAAQQGYTLDLAYVCGFFTAAFNLARLRTHLFTPMQWKGTRPKSATLAEYRRKFPDQRWSSEHSVDAVMLGYHFCKVAKLLV
jgi:hypothetical protein